MSYKKGFVRMDTISLATSSSVTATMLPHRKASPGSASLPPAPSQNASIYEYALWYHGLGFNVVPLERPEKGKTKKPTCKWKGWQSKRQDRQDLVALHHRCTHDRERHFAHGLLAIDGINDIRHFDLDQVTSYEEAVEPLLTALGLPKDYPWVVQSGSGKGYHLCFRCRGDITAYFPCKAGEEPKAVYVGDPRGDNRAFDHIELRWQAALTTLPPSRHWSGGRYTFVNARPSELPPYVPIDTVIAAFQSIAMLRGAGTSTLTDSVAQTTSPEAVCAPCTELSEACQAEVRWAQTALDNECSLLSQAREGSRNMQLNRSAFALGQIVAAGLLSETEVVQRLSTVAHEIGLEEREIASTIQSGLVAGSAYPRTPPRQHGEGTTSTNGPGETESPRRAKPCIVVNGRQETEIIEEGLAALVAANAVPYLFVRAGRLTRIKRDEHGRAHMEPVTEAMLRLRLLECAEWMRLDAKGNARHAGPTPQVVQSILARETWPFPPLIGISAVPIVRPDGSLVLEPGYDPVTCMVYAPAPGLKLAPIPDAPTRAEVEQALRRIFSVIGEFPYVSQADRANTLGLLLTPLLRYAFTGHVPLALVDAPKQGTGKGLLTDIVAILATGRPACPMQEPKDDDEWRKAITSLLLRGSSLIVIDNVDHTLHSARLSSALTLDTWGDRLLCKNESVEIPFKCTWIANGNNIRLGGDLGSRSYRIRLDARVSNPSARDHFTHKDLVGYVLAHRGELLSDLLTIIRFWYCSGCPLAPMPRMRTFSAWVELFGSMLAHAGVHEFLANLDKLRADADEQENQWYIFFKAWHDVLGEEYISTRSLSARIAGSDPAALSRLAESLPDFLGEARVDKPATFEIRLGKALRKQVDNCFGQENLRLERGTNAHTGQPLWRVVCAGSPPASPDPLQGFEPHLEPGHEDVAGDAGDAGDQIASQAEMWGQEEMTQAPPSGGQDAGRRPAAGEVHGPTTQVREEQHLPQSSPASPAAGEAMVQQGAGAASQHGEPTRPESSEASAERCRVQRCDGVPQETGWCAAHQERAEILRVGALLGYPVLNYAPEHATRQGEAAWTQFLQYPQCHRLAEQLLGYLREQYPEHFPQGAARSY
jgi:hypothetical protein